MDNISDRLINSLSDKEIQNIANEVNTNLSDVEVLNLYMKVKKENIENLVRLHRLIKERVVKAINDRKAGLSIST